jgi:hypothetical protein
VIDWIFLVGVIKDTLPANVDIRATIIGETAEVTPDKLRRI